MLRFQLPPDRSQTSLSKCKCSRARIDKKNNLTTIKMGLFTLLKPLKCAKDPHTDQRNSLAFSSRAEVTQRCLSQQLLRTHPASRAFLLLARFWRSRERLCMNRVRSLLNMRCMLPGYSLEPKPNMPDLAATLVFHGTAGSIITFILSLKGRSHWNNRFDERKQD